MNRELMKQCLDALSRLSESNQVEFSDIELIESIRAELEKSEPEPVAYMMVNGSSGHGRPLVYVPPTDWHITWKAIPLYTKGTTNV